MEKYLKPVNITIIIDSETNFQIKLNELLLFPHGFDGLHIWEAGIVLGRYLYFNGQEFKDKDCLELGSGVGIAGLSLYLGTQCKNVVLTDYKHEIINNLQMNVDKNVKKNSLRKCIVSKLDWTQHQNIQQTYDVIFGSDIIYSGCPIDDLVDTIYKSLNNQGKTYILIPDQRFFAVEFFKSLERYPLIVQEDKIELSELKYLQSPLVNTEEGYKTYPGLKELKFYIHIFKKCQ